MEKKVKLVTLAAIAAIVVACGLLAIPQYIVPVYPTATLTSISGYQFFFHAVSEVYEKNSGMSGVSGLGISLIVVISLGLIAFVLGAFKKLAPARSALLMLGGAFNVASAILFFCMEASKKNVYGVRRDWFYVSWIAYVAGALLIITGLVAVYFAIKSMQTEKKEIVGKKSYSYLKK